VGDPPLIVPVEDLFPDEDADSFYADGGLLRAYRDPPLTASIRSTRTDRAHGLQGGRGRQCRHPRPDPAVRGPNTGDPLFCRPEPSPRCWSNTGVSEYTNHGSGWWPVNG
jgi:hypothetical protein